MVHDLVPLVYTCYMKSSPALAFVRIVDLTLIREPYVISVEFKMRRSNQCASEWFITRREKTGRLNLILHLEMLLNSKSEGAASHEVEVLLESSILDLARRMPETNDRSPLTVRVPKELGAALAMVHIVEHRRTPSSLESPSSLIRKTAFEYELATQFGVNSPALLIASLTSTPVKTIHQRIYLAREQGIIKSFGKGRTSAIEEEDDTHDAHTS